jgi:hypothetical protein
MNLSTGASLITLSLLLNKVSGLYGILALLTGFHLSPLQLSMYMYSILALILSAYLAPHIRTQSPLPCIVLACFYVLDSIINAAYTAAFAVTWFLVLAQHGAGEAPKGSGAETIADTSGFTSPEFNVSSVEVVAAPGSTAPAAVSAVPANAPAGQTGNGTLANAVLSSSSMNSIGIIVALWTIRVYFCVIMLAYARMVLRQHIAAVSQKSTSYSISENPFATVAGWRGKLGRFLISIGRSYWLGIDEDDAWMTGMGSKFRRSVESGIALQKVETTGPSERERRRRSGTGPPPPPAPVDTGKGSGSLAVPMQNL